MNVVMKDCVFTDPRGGRFPYEIFFVHARNIRYVHIPANVSTQFIQIHTDNWKLGTDLQCLAIRAQIRV